MVYVKGERIMRKLLKDKKGFSLIEILIVIAIIGVLAVIAFSAFSGVLGNSQKRADAQQGRIISKAILAYIIASNDPTLDKLHYKKEGDASYTCFRDNATWTSAWDELLYALQTEIQDDDTDPKNLYEPFLSPTAGNPPDVANYAPQWNPQNSGKYQGYKIVIHSKNLTVNVKPVETGAGISIY